MTPPPRVLLVEVAPATADALSSALARRGLVVDRCVSSVDRVLERDTGDVALVVVGVLADADAQAARCLALSRRTGAPVVALVPTAPDGLPLAGRPGVRTTLALSVGMGALVGQLPAIIDRRRRARRGRRWIRGLDLRLAFAALVPLIGG